MLNKFPRERKSQLFLPNTSATVYCILFTVVSTTGTYSMTIYWAISILYTSRKYVGLKRTHFREEFEFSQKNEN